MRNFLDVLLQGVIVTGKLKSEETVSKNEFKTSWNNELKLDSWKEKRLHGQFLRQITRNNTCKRNLEQVKKSRLEDPNRSTYLCRPGTGSQDQPCN